MNLLFQVDFYLKQNVIILMLTYIGPYPSPMDKQTRTHEGHTHALMSAMYHANAHEM